MEQRQAPRPDEQEEMTTPLLDELEEGQWPSFVTEIKRAAQKSEAAADLLRQVERSYADNTGHWKRGGIVGVKGYGGGVVGRYSAMPEEFPAVKEFHTLRVNQPAGFYYTTEKLRQLCDVWDKYGSGLMNLHGSTGDIILLGTTTENLQPCFDALGEIGFDLGGSGSAMRTLSCCVGQSRCEYACIDTMDITREPDRCISRARSTAPRFPTSSRSSARAAPTIAPRPAPAPIWRSSACGATACEIDQQAVREYVARRLEPFRPGDPPLPDLGAGMGRRRRRAENQPAGLRPLHALHQPDAQGAARGPGARRGPADRRQGAGGQGGDDRLGAGPVHGNEAALRRAEGTDHARSSTTGPTTPRAANGWAS